MKTKRLFLATAVLSLCLFSCENSGIDTNEDVSETKSILVKGISVDEQNAEAGVQNDSLSENPIAFTSEDIEWFNTTTREIRFKDGIEPAKTLEIYNKIVFELDGETLFTAETIFPISSKLIYDLVLYVENKGQYKYFLHDAYPAWASETDEAKANAQKRAEGWNKFLQHLNNENRLKTDNDNENPSGGNNGNEEPYTPNTPNINTGDIDLIKFTPKSTWNWLELEPSKLNVIYNENELKQLISSNSYSASDIDFDKYTLFLVRVCTSSGIHQISSGLTVSEENTYLYSMKVLMNATCVIGDEVFAILAPAIAPDTAIQFDIQITDTMEE